jgi:hypothetical protein
MADRSVKVKLVADVSGYTSGLGKAAAETKALGGAADTAGRNTKTSLDGAGKSAQDAARQVAKIREQIAALGRAKIGVDTVAARVELDKLRKGLRDVDTTDAQPRVQAETAAAEAQLRAVQSQLNRIDGQSVRAHVDVDDSGATQRAAANLLTLSAAAQAVAPALGAIGAAAVAGIGAIGPLAASAASGLGVLALGFSGVSDTVKLLQQRHEAVAVQAGKSAGSQVNSAQQIESAQASLANAQASAADAGIRAAQRVADARRNETRAARDAADGIKAALQRQQDAEETLTREQRTQRQAQLDLISARREAAQQLEDLTASVEENSLAQRSSVLDVAQAQRELNDVLRDPKASNEERERARIAYEEQVFRQKQLSVQGRRLAAERADANAKGIEGSDQVAAAQQRVTAADESVADATRAVGRAAADVQKARVDGAEKIADAQRQVVDAVREQTAQQRQSAFTIAQAQRAVQAAMTATGAAGASALTGIDNKLAQVGPSTRKFAEFVDGTLRPAFQRLQETAAAGVLPGVQTGLEGLLAQEPRINRFVGAMATSIGGLVENSIGNLSNPAWGQFWSMLETRGVPELEAMWHTGDNIAQSFASIVTAFGPLSSDVATGVEGLTRDFADWAAQLGSSSGFHQFEAYVRENWPNIRDLIANVATTIGHLIEAGAPIAGTYLSGFKLLSDVLAGLPVGVVQALLVAFLAFRTAQSVIGTINGVADSVIALRGGVTGLPAKLGEAGKGLGGLKGAASGALSVLGGPWGIALGAASAALSGLTAIMAEQDQQIQSWGEALAHGGQRAQAAAEQAANPSFWDKVEFNLTHWGNTQDVATRRLNEAKQAAGDYWRSLSPLEQAQSKVADWSRILNERLHDENATTAEVEAAKRRYAYWTGEVARQQGQLDGAASGVNNTLAVQKQTLDALTGTTVDQTQAEADFYAAVARADGALNGMSGTVLNSAGSLNTQSEAGRAAAGVLFGVRDRANALIDSMVKQGATTEEVTAKDAELRQSFIATAKRMGISTEDAGRLADSIYGIPSKRKTTIEADTTAATAAVQKFMDYVTGQKAVVGFSAHAADVQVAFRRLGGAIGGIVHAYEDGGFEYMKGGIAQVVKPNTWRVIGDRVRDDEAYIPINNAPRSRQVLGATASRMGYRLSPMAAGGLLDAYSIPVDADLPTDDAGRIMRRLMASAGSGPLGGDWMSIYRAVHAAIPQARINSTYRAGDPGYHGRNKAIDFGFGSGPGGAGSAGLAAIARFLYAGYGKTLAELIYDGVGDNTPDVKNGADHTYNAATRAEHRNHVHAAVYHDGVDSVPRDGWAYLAKGEAVVPAEANARSREFSGAAAPAAAGARGLEGLRLVGTLDLGGGLEGRIDARVDQAFTGVANQLHYAGV